MDIIKFFKKKTLLNKKPVKVILSSDAASSYPPKRYSLIKR